jgi:hypothetical protein
MTKNVCKEMKCNAAVKKGRNIPNIESNVDTVVVVDGEELELPSLPSNECTYLPG